LADTLQAVLDTVRVPRLVWARDLGDIEMLLPQFMITIISVPFEVVQTLLRFDIATLPILVQYVACWIIISCTLGVLGLALIPMGSLTRNLGHAVIDNARSADTFDGQVRQAETGLSMVNLGTRLRNSTGSLVPIPDRRRRRQSKSEDTPSSTLLRIVASGLLALGNLFELIISFAKALVHLSWLNLLRWLIVVAYLQTPFIQSTDWSQVASGALNVDLSKISLSAVLAGIGLTYLFVGIFWRGGHKWAGKYFETAEGKSLEFLSSSITPLRSLRSQITGSVKKAESRAETILKSKVNGLSGEVCYLDDDWNLSCYWTVHRTRGFSGLSVGHSPSVDGPDMEDVELLRQLYDGLSAGGWERHLVHRSPRRLGTSLFWFEHRLDDWARSVEQLTGESIARRLADQPAWAKVAKRLQRADTDSFRLKIGESAVDDRTIANRAEVESILENGIESTVEILDSLISDAAEAVAEIQMFLKYALKQTTPSTAKRIFMGR
jgi:hypothetical protein